MHWLARLRVGALMRMNAAAAAGMIAPSPTHTCPSCGVEVLGDDLIAHLVVL